MDKILHISKYFYPFKGGTEQVALDIVQSLRDHCEQYVLCFNHKKGNIEETVLNTKVFRTNPLVKISSQTISAGYGKTLKKIINSFEPNIIIFHYPNPFAAHYLLKVLRKKPNIKLFIWWHLDITKQRILKAFFKGQNIRLLKRAAKIVATSPNYIDGSSFLSLFREKCIVIPNCVSEERSQISEEVFNRAESIKRLFCGKTLCFALGRHVEYKGFEYLIKASKLLDSSYAIAIAGEGKLTKKLTKMAAGDSKVFFLGRLSDNDLKAYLLACDIFCFPSITKNEAFGIALAEALYFKKPAITFTIPGSGVNYVSINQITGTEVPNRDYVSFAEAIKYLSLNPDEARKLGENGHMRVNNLFTFTSFKSNVLRAILH